MNDEPVLVYATGTLGDAPTTVSSPNSSVLGMSFVCINRCTTVVYVLWLQTFVYRRHTFITVIASICHSNQIAGPEAELIQCGYSCTLDHYSKMPFVLNNSNE